jgi:hypothetical protein
MQDKTPVAGGLAGHRQSNPNSPEQSETKSQISVKPYTGTTNIGIKACGRSVKA